ncbi:hypothetical protein LY76DRAFT_354394 [Colletotrichum caudatum]|nr:hypothetical protein LY76DRAFT_354394 [Colletotrichum caudatum]
MPTWSVVVDVSLSLAHSQTSLFRRILVSVKIQLTCLTSPLATSSSASPAAPSTAATARSVTSSTAPSSSTLPASFGLPMRRIAP